MAKPRRKTFFDQYMDDTLSTVDKMAAIPPKVDPAKQKDAAGQMNSAQQRDRAKSENYDPQNPEGATGGGSAEPNPSNLEKGGGDLGKGDIAQNRKGGIRGKLRDLKDDVGNDITNKGSAAKTKDDMATSVQLIKDRMDVSKNLKNKINQIKENVADDIEEALSWRSHLLWLIKKIPGIGIMITSFEAAMQKGTKKAITILEFIKHRLKNVESFLALADAGKHWVSIVRMGVAPPIIVILVILLLPLLFVMVILYWSVPAIFSPMARKVEKFIKENVDPMLKKLYKKMKSNRRRTAAKLQAENLERNAVGTTPPPQPA